MMSTPPVMIPAATFPRCPTQANNHMYTGYVVVARITAENRREERTENKSQLPQEQNKHQQKGHCK